MKIPNGIIFLILTLISLCLVSNSGAANTFMAGTADASQSTLTPLSATLTANGTATQVLTVTAKDASGTSLTTGGSIVAITRQSGTGIIGSVIDNGNGTYTATVTAPALTGSGIFVATLDGQPVQNGTASQAQSTVTYLPGPLHHFSVAITDSPRVATVPLFISIIARDTLNNIETGFGGTVGISVNSGTISPTTSGSFTNGVRSESVTLLQSGSGKIVSVNDGSGHTGSSSTFTLIKRPTAGIFTTSPNPSAFGQSVTFKDSLSGIVPDGGKVYFIVDGTTVDSSNVNGSGVASILRTDLSVGFHAIKSFYGGTSNYDTSTSNGVRDTVTKAHATVLLTSSLNPSTFGQSVTFSTHVDNLQRVPTGNVTYYDGTTLLGIVPLTGDSALESTGLLTGGSHTIKAVYSGDGNFNSDSTTITQVVNKGSPTVALKSSISPSTFGQNVTFTAHVDNASQTPTGSVTFYNGTTLLANVALTGDSALTSTVNLTAGSHTIKAFYSGDSNFKSDSTTLTQVVNLASPTVTLKSSLNPSTFTQTVTFTAHVDNAFQTPTGNVSFYNGTTLLVTVPLTTDSALTSTANLTAGSHTIKAVYSGDSNFKSDSTTIAQVVNQASPTVTLKSSLNPSTFGQNVTLAAHVDNASLTPAGSVTFYDGSTLLANVPLTSDSALTNAANLTTGSHTIKAVYSGDSNFKSDSTTIAQVVNLASPTVTLKSSLNPSAFGQNVTLTAHVDNASHTPTGSVAFYDGAILLANVSLTSDSALTNAANLTAGSHTIKAVYSGDSNFKSDSTTITQVVNLASPTVTLKSSLNPSTFGQNVTFTSHVDNASHTPTGSVAFYDGATLLANVPLTSDSALTSTTNLTAGSHTIKAVYSGDSNFRSDSTTITQVVNLASPTVTLKSSLNPSTFGQNVTFTSHVDNASHTPTGSVAFYDGATLLANVPLTGDSALTSTTNLTAGSHTIKAVYAGDSNFRSDSSTITQVVNQASPTVTLKSSLNPSTFTQTVTFTAHVDNAFQTPTGNVSFYDGTLLLVTVPLTTDSALTSTANLTAGSHTIKAVYSGDVNFRSDSTTIAQVVNLASATVTLTSGTNPSAFGQNVTFTSHVDNASHTPTGSVTFYDGTTLLATVALTGDSSQTSTANLTTGSHTIKAVYSGDSNFGSDSTTITQVVNLASAAVTLTSGTTPSTFGQNVTFTSHVDNASRTPTGSVTFYDGATLLATVALTGDSSQTSTANLTAGSHTMKAVYSGDSNFRSDSTTITQVVNQATPVVALKSSLNPSTFEQSVTFTAHVDSSSHTPTGSVTFYDGTTLLATVSLTGDSAQTSTANLTAGSHGVKAVYSGDSNFRSDSSTITQVVNQAAPVVALKSSLNPSTFEQSVTFTAHVDNASHTPTGSVTFYDGVTLLSTVPLTGDSAQTSSSNLTAGSHGIKVVYSGDSNFKSDSTTLTQVVNQASAAVALKSSLNPSTFGVSVTFTTHVDNASVTPTGSVTFYDGAAILATIPLTGDSAQTSTTNLITGSHTIKTVYSGDSNFRSDSTTITQVVTLATTAITLKSSLNPSTFEQSVTFTAHVDNASHTPTGSVTFYDGTTLLASIALTGDSAQTSTANLTAGSHNVKAVYSGDSNFGPDSTTLSQVVNLATPVMTLKSSLNPSTFGQSATFTAHVDNSTHTPTGSVTIYDGTTLLATVPMTGDSAQTSTANLNAGSHTVKAVYSGDSNFNTDSATITQVVNQTTPTVTLTSSLSPSTFEQNVTFTTHVNNASHTPTGSVTYYDGATLLATVALTADSAQTSSANLTAGSHSIKVVYSGDSNFTGDSTTITQLVNQATPTVTLNSSLNPSTFEQNVTFTVHVTNSSHTPTGSVTFYDGTSPLATVPLTGDSAQTSTANLATGSHSIKALYAGDGNFKSDSTTVTQVINLATPTVALTSSLNPSTFQQNVTFTVRVTNSSHTPTGSVAFYDGATLLATIPMTGDSALTSTSTLSTGSHSIKAVYSGDGSFRGDSTTMTQLVNKAVPIMALNSSLNPSTFEQNVTLTAHVDNALLTPTGTVSFYDGATLLAALPLTGDSAQTSTAGLGGGSHTIKAVYSGDGNFTSDSLTITQVVNQAPPVVTLNSSLNPSTFEQNVTFTAHADNASHTPTGSVTFYDGTTLLATVSLTGDSVQTSTANLTAGSHSIKAVYSGDSDFRSDSTNITQVVNQAAPVVALKSSLNPSTFEQNVTFTAHVDNSTHTPTGSIAFYDSAALLATITLTSDSAQLTTATLTAGSHSIKVVYSGDSNFKSDSATIAQVVNQSSPLVTLKSTPNPSIFGTSVTFTGHVNNSSHIPTGSISFYDGTVLLAIVPLTADSAQTSPANLTTGSHLIKAVYSGDSNFKSDSTTITQVVNKASPTVTLKSSQTPSTFEQSVTFTAHVDNIVQTPTGSVSFYDGTAFLGTQPMTGDSAQLSTSNLTAGSHTIKAVYSGDGNFRSDSTTITQVVNQTPPTVTLKSSLNPSAFEQNVTFTAIVLNSSVTPTGLISFYDGATLLANVSLTGDSAQTSTSTLTTGSHIIKIIYSGDNNFRGDSTTITQVVNPATPVMTLKSSLNPSIYGQNVTFTAHVDNSVHTPTGNVSFYDATTLLATVPLTGDSAQTSSAGLSGGSHTIKAVYSGDGNFTTDSTTITQVVNSTSSTLTLRSSLNPSAFGQNVTFTVLVSSLSITPTGSISFYDGTTLLATLPLAGDSAQTSTPNLTAGSHIIKAVYSGDSNFKTDSTTISQVVNQASPIVTLTSSLNPSTFGQNVTFTAHVDSASHTPTGNVSFYDGTVLLATVPLTTDSAQTSTAGLTGGSHTIKVLYSGDGNFKSDSTTITQVVNKASPTVTLTSSLNPSVFDQNVVFTAHAISSAGTPTGSVSFYDGTTLLAAVSLIGDSALTSTTNLTAASHSIKAVYAGDNNFRSDSVTITQVVNQGSPVVTLISSLNPSTFQQSVTFTAHIDDGGHTPTGSVTMYDGTVSLGTFSLAGDSARFTTSTLATGTHTMKVVYNGDNNFRRDSTTLVQTVNQASSTVTLKSSLNPTTFGQSVTFTAYANGSPIAPTGSFTFYDGTNSLGTVPLTSDSAQTTISVLTVGQHSIKAVYSGDVNYRRDSTTVIQTVNPAGITITLKSSLNPSTIGQVVVFTAHVDNSTQTPTGSVVFYDGSIFLRLVPLTGDSSQVSAAALLAGTHTIKAIYSGDNNFRSDSTTMIQVVNRLFTASRAGTKPNPSLNGQAIVITDTVSPAPDSGRVFFTDNNTQIGFAILSPSGIASFSTSSLLPGTHLIEAFYNGSGTYDTSTSNIVTQIVSEFSVSATNLTSSPNPSTYSQIVTFKATVTGGLVKPTGSVIFMDSTVALDTVSLDSTGKALLNTGILTAGTHPITAVYLGDILHANSVSGTVRQVVNRLSTAGFIRFFPTAVSYEQPITFIDSITGPKPDGGTIQFRDGANNLGNSMPIDSFARGQITVSSLTVGWHAISAVYSGSSNFAGCTSRPTYINVSKKATTSIVSISPTRIMTGDTVMMRDSVDGAAPDSGFVQFMEGNAALGAPIPLDANSSATYATSILNSGNHTVYAIYLGTANYASSTSNPVTIAVIDTDMYRSFDPDSIALAADNLGKIGKGVLRKNTRIYFIGSFAPPINNLEGIHVEFSYPVDTALDFYSVPASSRIAKSAGLTKWEFKFINPLSGMPIVKIYGFAKSTLPQKIPTFYWLQNGTPYGPTVKNPALEKNQPSMPMPNRINALMETYRFNGYASTGGLLVGLNHQLPFDSSGKYGWLLANTYSTTLGSLRSPLGLHTGYARGLDYYTSTSSPIVGRQSSLPPTKQNNVLVADMIALKMNITASALGITPYGFGELIFRDSVDNPLNGKMVKEIGRYIDSMMSGWYHGGIHYFADTSVYRSLHETVRRIDDAFEGKIDTIKFADTLRLTGTRSVSQVTFLHHDPTIPPTVIEPTGNPMYDIPVSALLYQNYPNPFNPSTTIRFELPYTSVVTLTVYNILGQEVAKLADRTPMDMGIQELFFNGSRLSSGAYFYRLVAEPVAGALDTGQPSTSSIITRKMMLLK